MGGVSWLAQCALDFLIEERCHACGNTGVFQDHAETSPLSAPVNVFSLGAFKLTTRLLCDECACQVKKWPGHVILPAQDALSRVYRAVARLFRCASAVCVAFSRPAPEPLVLSPVPGGLLFA